MAYIDCQPLLLYNVNTLNEGTSRMDDILRKRRSKDQKEVDIVKIAPLYLQGLNYREIADKLGLSIKQVSSDILSIKEEWRKAYIEDFNEFRKRELLKIDLIEAEAWKAWEKSKRGRTSTTKSAEDSQQFGARKSATEEHMDSHGDVQYLQLVQSCVTSRMRLLGAYGAAKIEAPVTEEEDENQKFSREEVLSLIDSIAGRVVSAATQQPANLLEAMRNGPQDVIDAQYEEVSNTDVKQLNPATDTKPIETEISATLENFDSNQTQQNIVETAQINNGSSGTTSSINGNPDQVSSEEPPEDQEIVNRKKLLEAMKGRKAEKSPDPRYEIPRTRKDDIRTILKDLDAAKVSNDIYEERVSELDSSNFRNSVTNRTISGKNKITK